MRIGYFIPQFPGQTHSMFWREYNALKKFGVDPVLISTRKPSEHATTHTWSQWAMDNTFYLYPFKLKYLIHGLGLASLHFKKVYSLMRSADLPSFKDKLKYFASFILGCELASFVMKEHLKHIHIHSSAESLNIALFAEAISGVTYSVTLHNPLVIFGANQKQKWSHASFGIVVTDDLLSQVQEELKHHLPKKIYSVAMGVDLSKFRIEKRWPHSTIRLFSCGRIHRCKGYDILIKALSKIKEAFHLRIAGGIDEKDPQALQQLKNLVEEYGLEKKIDFLGAISEEKLVEELNQADLFVLTSRVETIGVAYMEAMCMGLPVIATNVGGVKELVEHGKNGFLVESENIEQISKSVQILMKDPWLRSEMGKAGRKKIIESFSSDNSALKILEGINDQSPLLPSV